MACQFCHKGLEREGVCGMLHSVVNEKCHCVAHHKCMQYSSNLPQYKFPQFGGFYIEDVEREVKRGQKLKCSICKRAGATAGCALKDCKKTYHFPCAKESVDVRTCRLVKHASQDVDPQSTIISYCVFCNASHKHTYTENLSLTSADELSSSNSEDNMDNSTCAVGNVTLSTTMDLNEYSVGTSSTTVSKAAVDNISISDAAVAATPSCTPHVDQNIVDSTPRSQCRRDRLSLKKSKARQVDCENEETQFEPLLQETEFRDYRCNGESSNKRARLDSSPEALSGAETIDLSLSSAETVKLKNGCVGESGFNNGVLPDLAIPDPMDDQVCLKQPRNFPNISASSLQMKTAKMSQSRITSFLTPAKKLDRTVTGNFAKKDKPKAQKHLQISGSNTKLNVNVIQTGLINESIHHDFNPLPSGNNLPMTDPPIENMNTSPISEMTILPNENTNTSLAAEMSVSPITEIVSVAKETCVSSVSLGLENVDNLCRKSNSVSDVSKLADSPSLLRQNSSNTVRKLVLDGKGNFSLLTEIKSSNPLYDSSNDSSYRTNSHNADSSDMDWNSASSLSNSSCEELSSTFVMHQMEKDTELDRVYGLCIPVTDERLDDRKSKALLRYAICSLDLVEENIFLWQISGLNEIQITSLILKFSRYLRDKNELELLKKLFKQNSFDADFLLGNEISVTEDYVQIIQQEIEKNFSEAEEKYGRCVGKLCSFEDPRLSAAFLILSNSNDNTSAARSSLPKNHRVHICNMDTNFFIPHNVCDVQRILISDNEYENLKWWLDTFDYSTVLLYPMENVLRSTDASSVTNRLKNYFVQRMVPGGDTNFIFIQRTNPDLLIYRSFICKMLAFVKEEVLTCKHDACIVFDVGQDLRIVRLADVVMSCLLGDQSTGYCIEVEAFSGTNPMFSPISCLVLHLVLRS